MNAVIELRQYTLHPGQRDTLIELFEREFVKTQEAVGISVLGRFRDIDDPDRFVWLRGFADMAARAEALQAFYGGPTWLAHREAANATMIDSDNVLLLRSTREPAPALAGDVVIAALYQLPRTTDATRFQEFFDRKIEPAVRDAGGKVLFTGVSEHASNNFPQLPVREGENVFVWMASFHDLEEFSHRRGEIMVEAEQTLRLAPV